MGNAINADRKAIWLSIRRHGGWWTVRQVVAHWRPTFAEFEVEEAVKALVAGCYLVARDDVSPGHTAFAFTSECQVLPGTEEEEEKSRVVHP